MKICHVITRMIVGGAQENTLYSLRGHLEHGHEATLVTGPTTGPEGKLLEAQQVRGLNVVVVPDLVRQLDPWRDLRAWRQLRRIFATHRFDIVHTHSSKAGVIGRLAARRAGIPVVVHTVHGQAFHRYEKWWRNRLYIAAERLAARRSDRIYAVAQAMIDQCVAAGVAPRRLYRTVYSGMELDVFLDSRRDAALAEELKIPEGVPVVGKVARLFELKGYEYLTDAAPVIAAAFPDVRFLIVGDGVLRGEIERRFAAAGLRDNVIFAGLVAPSEMPRYIGLMDVLVHLSLREGLPRTVVQALASAKPVVGVNLDGTPEVVADGRTGRLCPPADGGAVAAAVIELLKCPEQARRMGKEGRRCVRQKWDWRYMVDVLEADYQTLLAQR